MKSTLILRQTLERPINGYWDGGMKQTFDWRIDRAYDDGKSRVGSWGANHFFEVQTGNTEKQTLANARRHLQAGSRRTGIAMTFAYIEEE